MFYEYLLIYFGASIFGLKRLERFFYGDLLKLHPNSQSRMRHQTLRPTDKQVKQHRKRLIHNISKSSTESGYQLEQFLKGQKENIKQGWFEPGCYPLKGVDYNGQIYFCRTLKVVDQGSWLTRPIDAYKDFEEFVKYAKQTFIGQHFDFDTLQKWWLLHTEYHKASRTISKEMERLEPERQALLPDLTSPLLAALTLDFESISNTRNSHSLFIEAIASRINGVSNQDLRKAAIKSIWQQSPEVESRNQMINVLSEGIPEGRPRSPESVKKDIQRWQKGKKRISQDDQFALWDHFGMSCLGHYYAYYLLEAVEAMLPLAQQERTTAERWSENIEKWRAIPEFQ